MRPVWRPENQNSPKRSLTQSQQCLDQLYSRLFWILHPSIQIREMGPKPFWCPDHLFKDWLPTLDPQLVNRLPAPLKAPTLLHPFAFIYGEQQATTQAGNMNTNTNTFPFHFPKSRGSALTHRWHGRPPKSA